MYKNIVFNTLFDLEIGCIWKLSKSYLKRLDLTILSMNCVQKCIQYRAMYISLEE